MNIRGYAAGAAVVALTAGAVAFGVPARAGSDDATTLPEWPMYGANLANSRTVAGGPSATQAASLTQAWRLDVADGDFEGTPVVAGGVVYVGSTGGVVRAIQAVSTSAHAAGTVLWSRKLDAGVNGSLAVHDGTVYVPVARAGSPYVTALEAGSGEPEWSTVLDTSTDADVFGSPVVVEWNDRELVLEGVSAVSGDPPSPLRGSLSALDAESGRVVWKTYTVPETAPDGSKFNGGAVWSTPAVDRAAGTVYIGTGNAYSGMAAPTTDSIMKLDLGTGAILDHFQATSGDVFSSMTPGLDFDFGASPNLVSIGSQLLVGEGQKEGTYWLVDRANLQHVIWNTQIGTGSAVGGILGSTAYDAAAQQIVGPNSAPGYAWSLDAAKGTPKWVTAAAGDAVHFSPVAVSNGVVYSLASGGFLAAWQEGTGVPIMEYPLNAVSPTSTSYALAFGGVAVADGLVIANSGSGNANGSIVAFRA